MKKKEAEPKRTEQKTKPLDSSPFPFASLFFRIILNTIES